MKIMSEGVHMELWKGVVNRKKEKLGRKGLIQTLRGIANSKSYTYW